MAFGAQKAILFQKLVPLHLLNNGFSIHKMLVIAEGLKPNILWRQKLLQQSPRERDCRAKWNAGQT